MKTLGYSTVGSVLDLGIKILIALCPPEHWAGWITYILEGLQNEANKDDYSKLLHALRQSITERLEHGGW